MPQVMFSQGSVRDLQRLQDFLKNKSPVAARKVAKLLQYQIKQLGLHPEIGRSLPESPLHFREWIVDFGDSGYIIRYSYLDEQVVILAVRHQKEVGF